MVSIREQLNVMFQRGRQRLLTAILNVDTRGVLAFTLTRLEDTLRIVTGSIVRATDTIVDVLAKLSGTRASRIADLEAELASAHEVVPLMDLLVVVATLVGVGGEVVGVDETAEGVTTLVSAMGIEFTSRVVGLEVDEWLVQGTGDLNIVGGTHEGDAGDATLRDDAGAVTGLRAPSNHLTLGVGDDLVRGRRGPEAEVYYTS